ncbi:putative Ribophorin I [Giardia muris]|uniref:Putative Ribophorin I n=1 Tax=Giardia muris TaxID=5742 RepID=A0A4Z1T013_GIAMU|nr:putative Ribophorin I [Giardia muris]|eukprot:TNJ27233.1 putative Ribophorin I [Giardia muris]
MEFSALFFLLLACAGAGAPSAAERIDHVERRLVVGADGGLTEALTVALGADGPARFVWLVDAEKVGHFEATCGGERLRARLTDEAALSVDVPRGCASFDVVVVHVGLETGDGGDGAVATCLEARIPAAVAAERTTLSAADGVALGRATVGDADYAPSQALPALRDVAALQCTPLMLRYERRRPVLAVQTSRDVRLAGFALAPAADRERFGLARIRDEILVRNVAARAGAKAATAAALVVELPCAVEYATVRYGDRIGKIDGLRILAATATGTRVSLRPRHPLAPGAKTRLRLEYTCALVMRVREKGGGEGDEARAASLLPAPLVRDAFYEAHSLCLHPPAGSRDVALHLSFPASQNPVSGGSDGLGPLDSVARRSVCVASAGRVSAAQRFETPVVLTWKHDEKAGVDGLREKLARLWLRLFAGLVAISVARVAFGF